VNDPDPQNTAYSAALTQGVRDVVAKATSTLNRSSLGAMVQDLIAVGDATLTTLAANDPPAEALACGEGCAHCCRVQVHVSIIEALNIAQGLIDSLVADDLSALKSRIAALDDQTHGMTHKERGVLALPCPLLKDERCSVYDTRPFVCRAANSVDAEQCRVMLTDGADTQVTSYEHQKTVYATIGAATAAGLADGQQAAGIEAAPGGMVLELAAALRIALDHADPITGWVDGVLDFDPAKARRG
jgi:Fe-S-cluster containining protein